MALRIALQHQGETVGTRSIKGQNPELKSEKEQTPGQPLDRGLAAQHHQQTPISPEATPRRLDSENLTNSQVQLEI